MTTWIPELEAKANARIGELIREGQTWYYAILQGGYEIKHQDRAEIFAYVMAEERALEPDSFSRRPIRKVEAL
jgi:hypothetical protein